MEKAILLFNGIKLPFALMDKAFSWARQSDAEILAIFLRAKNDRSEGYIFPSDLHAAENLTSTEDAGASHEQLIDANVRIVENQSTRDKVTVRTIVLTDPTTEQLKELVTGSSIIFAHESIVKPGTLTTDRIDLEDWLKNSPISVEIVQG